MIKYLVKYIKSVKNFIRSRNIERYRFKKYKEQYYLESFNKDNRYLLKEHFQLSIYYYNKVTKIYYNNDIYNLSGRKYRLYLPISYNLLMNNLK